MATPPTRPTSRSPPSAYHDQGKLHAVQVMLCARVDDLLAELEVPLYRSKKLFTGPCPIHGGDNAEALNLYPEGESRPGYWVCNTRGCHNTFKKTILGFVRGVLSNQKYGWEGRKVRIGEPEERTESWAATVNWCCDFLGTTIDKVEVDNEEVEKRRFAADMAAMTRRPEKKTSGLTRATVRRFLKPPKYFVDRGWGAEVLDKFDVGYYPAVRDEQGKLRPLAHRVAVPIYDTDYKWVIGFTGRSVFPKCEKCGRWHAPDEPCPEKGNGADWARTAKWRNVEFDKDSALYGYWLAKAAVRDTGTVVLVEGPGDCWRMNEAGYENTVAMLGTHLSDEQGVLLEMSGCMNVVAITNNDEAGQKAKAELKTKLGRSFRLHFPSISGADLGEMSVERVRTEVGPLLTRLAERKY